MIKFDKVKFEYVGHDFTSLALENIDFEVNEGEYLAIIGHNGSGKSTIAKLMNALLIPQEGVVYVSNIDTKDEEMIWEVRKTAGMVFQNPDNQIVATIVEEDVAFGPENLGIERNEIRKRVDESLQTVGMMDYISKPPHLLSGGQKQRIAIAGVLAMKPKVIILDEPTAMLDPLGRKEVIQTIEKLNREEGITIINITHFMDEAIRADRVIAVEEGKVVLEGHPKNVFNQVEVLRTMGLDVPQVSYLAYLLREEGVDIPNDILTIEEMVENLWQLL